MIRKIIIQILFNTTARVFGGKSRCILLWKADSALAAYAKATRAWMKEPADKYKDQQMYEEMHRLGRTVRRLWHIRSEEQACRCIKYLYKCIGIDVSFEQREAGTVMNVSRCFFSSYYTEDMCRFISMMDKGLVCGVSGRQDFYFTDRITEGCGRCTAHLK